jgi:hypothetical protein
LSARARSMARARTGSSRRLVTPAASSAPLTRRPGRAARRATPQ